MTQQPVQSKQMAAHTDKLESFKKEVIYLRSLGLLPSALTPLAVQAARKKLKTMNEEEIIEAKRLEDERIQADGDFMDAIDDDEIWTEI